MNLIRFKCFLKPIQFFYFSWWFVKFRFFVLYGDNFLRHCRHYPWIKYAIDNTPAHCSQISYPMQESDVVTPIVVVPTEQPLHDASDSELFRWKTLWMWLYIHHT